MKAFSNYGERLSIRNDVRKTLLLHKYEVKWKSRLWSSSSESSTVEGEDNDGHRTNRELHSREAQ